MIQLLALYTDPKSHNAQRYKQTDVWTDRQTDDMMMPIADHSSMIGKNLDHSPRKKPTTPRCLSMWKISSQTTLELLCLNLWL